MSPYDRWLGLRVFALTATLVLLTLTTVVVTDEATSTAGMRTARLAALGPVLASIAALFATAHARVRGELRALEAIGVSPFGAARGAAMAAWICGAASLCVLLSPLADAASLFPAIHPVVPWVLDSARAVARAPGASVLDTGAIVLSAAHGVPAPGAPGAWAALPCLVPMALFGPVWAVERISAAPRVVGLLGSGALAITLLHFVAAGKISSIVGLTTSLPIGAAVLATRRSRVSRGRA